MKTRNLLDRIYAFISYRPVYHGLFWLVLSAFMFFDGRRQGADTGTILINEGITLAFHAILVYFNLYYLIPRYLAKQAFLYFGFLLCACVLITPIEVLFFYLRYSSDWQLRIDLIGQQLSFWVSNVFVMILSTILRVIMDWWRYQTEKQVLLTKTMQSELRFLKTQINPHFLFNTLNNLYALTLQKSDKAPSIVLKLSEIMRYMLYECNERQVLLSKEIHYINNYLDLERLRQPKETDISFTVEGLIGQQTVAPLLFVPFLENSFKHGLNHHVEGDGYVRLHLRVQGEDMEFFIENSKVDPIQKQEHPRSGGIGLLNLSQRLDILYPGNHTLEVQNDPYRYAVTLFIKMEI
jgi:two-component system, LytTR family, sensor kinase